MNIEAYIEQHLKEQFLNVRDPQNPGRVPTEADWQAMPSDVKKQLVDLIKDLPLMKLLVKTYEQKHTDFTFGMIIKAEMKKIQKS